jgi:hypothetical protein
LNQCRKKPASHRVLKNRSAVPPELIVTKKTQPVANLKHGGTSNKMLRCRRNWDASGQYPAGLETFPWGVIWNGELDA